MALKLGLCCLFYNEPIKFKTYTNTALQKLSTKEQKEKIQSIILHNISTLQKAIDYCYKNNITSYRFSSDLFPHFQKIKEILTESEINFLFEKLSKVDNKNVTLSCHPGQHVNLGSLTEDVVKNSIADLEYHRLLCESLNAKECNIHLGGQYGNKTEAKRRFIEVVNKNNLKYLTIENDELSYSVEDCLEVANELVIPVTFDLHHHRCHALNQDYSSEFSEYELFLKCKDTWIKAGYNYMRMHLSNPKENYSTPSKSRAHSDLIHDVNSIPEWLIEESKHFDIHLDIEAKHKEVAIFKLLEDMKAK
jgi:UV DNA damage endonuclease